MKKVWVLQEVENSYEAETTILAIFDSKPSMEALRNIGLDRLDTATELLERHHADCGTYFLGGAYILEEYELIEVNND